MKNSALVVVDMLYDFIDGSLACGNAEEAVKEVVKYINAHPEQEVIYITDCHPANHSSFAEFGGIWPSHCVEGTRGGAIHEAFYTDVVNLANRPDPARNIFRKGCKQDEEQYSGFESVNSNGVALKDYANKDVVISGIATEYCVRNTCEDLLKAGYKVHLLKDCIAYVEHEGHLKALEEMAAEGIDIE